VIPYSAYAPECVEVVFCEVRYKLRGHLFSCRLSGRLDQPAIVRLFDELPDVLSMLGVPVFADDKPGSGEQPQLFDQDPVIDTELFVPMGRGAWVPYLFQPRTRGLARTGGPC
jgi:hypothetical protein